MGEPASAAVVIIRVIDNRILGGVSRLATPMDSGSKPLGVGIEVSELEGAVGDGEDVVLSLSGGCPNVKPPRCRLTYQPVFCSPIIPVCTLAAASRPAHSP